jgi:hypothetical protein
MARHGTAWHTLASNKVQSKSINKKTKVDSSKRNCRNVGNVEMCHCCIVVLKRAAGSVNKQASQPACCQRVNLEPIGHNSWLMAHGSWFTVHGSRLMAQRLSKATNSAALSQCQPRQHCSISRLQNVEAKSKKPRAKSKEP